jgi:hypothetical protein
LARIFAENLPPVYPYEVSGAPQQVKAQDFDGRVDVLPVSDPNIFSMAQRVTLAQQQLQLAQSNPQMHNLHAAYRRMYQALEVQNINEILPPPPQPQPKDPAMENSDIISGQPAKAFPPQDHDAHIQAHLSLLNLPILQNTPPVLAGLFTHVLEHVSLKAREAVMEQIQSIVAGPQQQMQQLQQMAQAGAISPQQAQQQMQQLQPQQFSPEQVEAQVAIVEAELMADIMPRLAAGQKSGGEDPLVQIRMQELQIKQMEAEHKAAMDQAKIEIEGAKLEQRAVTDAARLDLQEEIADNRNEVNQDRIEMQRESMMRKGLG